MATERVKVRFEVSGEFRRDREKDFVLPHKDSVQALNMTEMISQYRGHNVNRLETVKQPTDTYYRLTSTILHTFTVRLCRQHIIALTFYINLDSNTSGGC